VLHDLRRGKAAVYGAKGWVVADMRFFSAHAQAPPPTKREKEFQELWREFYRSTTTRERLNYAVQRGNMPKKYWKHLVEAPGEFHGKDAQI
jgi:probable DNA metabolism protein